MSKRKPAGELSARISLVATWIWEAGTRRRWTTGRGRRPRWTACWAASRRPASRTSGSPGASWAWWRSGLARSSCAAGCSTAGRASGERGAQVLGEDVRGEEGLERWCRVRKGMFIAMKGIRGFEEQTQAFLIRSHSCLPS